MKHLLFFLTLCFSFSAVSQSAPLELRIVGAQSQNDASHQYFTELFSRALKAAPGEESQISIQQLPYEEGLQGALIRLIEDDIVDFGWSAASPEKETSLLPVRIPLVMGLLGYRVAITHEDSLSKLDTVINIKSAKACQVHHWKDYDILKVNGFTVAPVNTYEINFELTHKKRCDYFPRAIYEGYTELQQAQKRFPELVMFDDILLYYPYPLYVYTSKDNPELNQLFHAGLMAMVESGELLEHIKKSDITRHLFPLERWRDKQLVRLENPFLTSETPLDDKRLWLDLINFE